MFDKHYVVLFEHSLTMITRREILHFVNLTLLFLQFNSMIMFSSSLVLHPQMLFHSSFKQDVESTKDVLLNMDFKSCVSAFNVSNAFDVMTYARHSNLCEMYENRRSPDSTTFLQSYFYSATPPYVMMFKYNTGK